MDEWMSLDATAQSELVRKKEVTAKELVEAALQRIEQLNPKLNAVVTLMADEALAAAETPKLDAPFAGVPFLLKDLGPAYGGVRLTEGTSFLQNYIPPVDSPLVTRYKQAGLITVGKTNTPEFGLVPTTEPKLFGACHNPWDLGRTPGGSSGGSAAAVAVGMVPMAHGNDGGGSIRIPASCCGLFGLKPSRGRNPRESEVLAGLSVDHALTRSVRDSAALLDVTQGALPGAHYTLPKPSRPFVEEVGKDPGKLKIAFTTVAPTGVPIHKDCIEAVHDAARLCVDLGHEVIEASPSFNGQVLEKQFIDVWAVGCALSIDHLVQMTGQKATPDAFEPLTWALYEKGKQLSASDYLTSLAILQQTSREIGMFFEEIDIWLTPTLAEPPVPLGTFEPPAEDPIAAIYRGSAFVPYTPLFNMTGQPAMSVPLFWNDEGLPVGTHFVGRYGDEATLFRLAAQLEEARPWADRYSSLQVL